MSFHNLLLSAPSTLASLLDTPGNDDNGNLSRMKIGIAVAGLIALFYEASREAEGNPVPMRWKKIVGATLAVIGVVSYFQFFQIGYKDFYHRWEFFHYYVGAKYYKELGFEGIYTCSAVAESQLPETKADPANAIPYMPAGKLDVRTRKLRDLKNNLIVDVNEWVDHPEVCESKFTPEKWETFKQDVAFFRRVMWGSYWRDSQKDHGYNPPPAWGITGWLFANLHPATVGYMKLLSCLDIGLFSAMFGLIAWAFGWRVMCIAIVFWGTQDASPFYWTGGAFLRQDWLFYAMASACMIRKQKHFWGGAFLMYSTLLRVFPLFFFGGWVVVAISHMYRNKTLQLHPLHKKIAMGSIAAALVLIPVSSAIHGWRAWPDFIHHIGVHNGTPLTNHMGWKTIVSHTAPGRMQVAKDMRMEDPFQKWKDMRRDRAKELKVVLYGGILAMFGMFAYACWRLKNLWVVEALGCLTGVIGVELTDYYYSFFLYGAMLSKGRRPIEFALLIASVASEIAHLQYGFFDDRFVAMSVVFLILALFMVLMYMRRPWLRAGEVTQPLHSMQVPSMPPPAAE